MDKYELYDYLYTQIDEILKFKWIRSEEEHHDIGGNKAAEEWIGKYADKFRTYWECQHCSYYPFCDHREDGENW